MAVEIPRFLQTKTYSAKAMRSMLLDMAIQSGVVNAGDLMVTQRGAGANMSVDVAAGAAWLKGTSSSRQGAYNVYNDSTVNVAIAAANATNPRIDQVILRVYDSVDGGSAQDVGTIEVVTGTATAGATLNNRTGVGALPAHSLLIGDVLVPASSSSVTNANIRDRRQWARGAFLHIKRTSGSISYAGTGVQLVDSTNLFPRVELVAGNPVRLTFTARIEGTGSSNNARILFRADLSGTLAYEAGTAADVTFISNTQLTSGLGRPMSWVFVPSTSGSYQIGPAWWTSGVTTTIAMTADMPAQLLVEELVRQNTANNTTTTG